MRTPILAVLPLLTLGAAPAAAQRSDPPVTIVASPVADAPAPSTPAVEPSIADQIDKAIGPARVAEPVPDPEQGKVANLNAGIIAAEAAKANAAAQAAADYQRQLDEHRRQVAEVEARNARARADHAAAVQACAAGDFSKCGGPPAPVRQKRR